MSIRIVPYEADHVPAVREFNARVRAGGVRFQFPEEARSSRFPPEPGRAVYQEYFLAVEGEAVRGGYILKHHRIEVAGETIWGAVFRLPISEGAVNRRYALVGLELMKDALRRQSHLYILGLGGADEPLGRLARGLGWDFRAIPFRFRLLRPGKFLRRSPYVRRSPVRRALADVAAWTGLGSAGVRLAHRVLSRAPAERPEWTCVERFGPWADEVWEAARGACSLVSVRDSAALDVLYPPQNERFLRLAVSSRGRAVGWALLLDTRMSGNSIFDDLRVGSIADGLALPGYADAVVFASVRLLAGRGVDLIVSNQSHEAWLRALRRSGFLSGPTNFFLALSPALAERWKTSAGFPAGLHVNRGDGDGPIHL